MVKDTSHIANYSKDELIYVFEKNAEKFAIRLEKANCKPKTKAIEREINICNEHIEICLRTIELLK